MTARAWTRAASLAFGILAAGLLGACDNSANPVAGSTTQPTTGTAASSADAGGRLELTDWVVDPAVVESERDSSPLRIACTSPACTEICCALGLREQIVARSRYCDHPPGIEQVASIGALIDTNVEALLELRPDVVLISGPSRQQTDRLRPLGLRIESIPDATLPDLFTAIRRVGGIAGRPRSAELLCEKVNADLDAVDRRFAKAPPRRVLLLIDTLSDPPRPPHVAGPGSFYDELLRRAGCSNVVPDDQSAFAPLSLEFILEADPDVIIELDPDGTARPRGDGDALAVWSKVGELRAVRDRRVHVLSGPMYYLLGPRIALVYSEIRAAIAGE